MGLFKERDVAGYRRAFVLYKIVSEKMTSIELSRGETFGIAVDDDKYAKRWQALVYRREVLESFLSGRAAPNPSFALWLTKDEYERLLREYCDICSS